MFSLLRGRLQPRRRSRRAWRRRCGHPRGTEEGTVRERHVEALGVVLDIPAVAELDERVAGAVEQFLSGPVLVGDRQRA